MKPNCDRHHPSGSRSRHHVIDTAPVYGFGRSEEIVGKALAEGGRRARVLIATKVGLDWKDGKPFRNASRARIPRRSRIPCAGCEPTSSTSIRCIGPIQRSPIEETAEAMQTLLRAGQDPRHRRQQFFSRPDRAVSQRCAAACAAVALQSVRARHRGRPPALLPQNTSPRWLWRAVPRPALRPHAARYGFRGRRSAKHRPEIPAARFAQYLPAVQRLDRFAQERFGKRVIHLAVRWILDQGITMALWGARHPDQLQPVDEVSGWRLDAAAKAEIDRILRETIADPVGPEFMAPPARGACNKKPARSSITATKVGVRDLSITGDGNVLPQCLGTRPYRVMRGVGNAADEAAGGNCHGIFRIEVRPLFTRQCAGQNKREPIGSVGVWGAHVTWVPLHQHEIRPRLVQATDFCPRGGSFHLFHAVADY